MACGRNENFDVVDPFRRQKLFQMRRMARLAARLAFGLRLDDGLGSVQGIGRRRR